MCCRFKRKRKPRRFCLTRLPFANCANGSLSFVRLLTKNQTEVFPFANGLNGLNGLAHLYKYVLSITFVPDEVKTSD